MYELGYVLGIFAVIFFTVRWIYRKNKNNDVTEQSTPQQTVVVQKKSITDRITGVCKMIFWLFIALLVIIFLTLDWEEIDRKATEDMERQQAMELLRSL